MYVDEHGDDTSTTPEADSGNDELTVEMDGESYEVEENEDFDRDGHNDTAVVETEDGYIAFADTDGDGTADVAVEFDQDGNVVAGAEYDEASGEWVEEDVKSLPTPSGDGADEGDSGRDRQASDTDDKNDRETDDRDSGTITVDTPNGEVTAGEAEYDTDGDGVKDTAIVTDDDGTTYAFTDTDHDGTADTAVVIEADGDVTVAENTGGDDWKVVEEGHLNPDGTYESDSRPTGGTDASSDELWADAK
ncbi:DUF6802 family protein [Actinophytocola sp.]|uniref:DUF6802 family protein n=1 Tax=Actinophytocola sp. TaxID=1872138 RepID=UPI002D803C8A|nr:DUF6802 family protein [Actinophytocola sp.]HET9144310.1 DUF6802 family protein [Actinophytocola sp.]